MKECDGLFGERPVVWKRAWHIKEADTSLCYAACSTICAVIVKKLAIYFDGPFHGFRANDLRVN